MNKSINFYYEGNDSLDNILKKYFDRKENIIE